MRLYAECCLIARRKEIDHVNLVSEICEQLRDRFHPTMSEIKKHIDALIDKEVYILSACQYDAVDLHSFVCLYAVLIGLICVFLRLAVTHADLFQWVCIRRP